MEIRAHQTVSDTNESVTVSFAAPEVKRITVQDADCQVARKLLFDCIFARPDNHVCFVGRSFPNHELHA